MTKDEIVVIHEVANDVKWLKKATEDNAQDNSRGHEKIIVHLTLLNGRINKNRTTASINRYGLIGAFIVEGILITVILHLIGVY